MGSGQKVRWFFRLAIPAAMVGWGAYELVTVWDAGWVWKGYRSAIACFVALSGALWLFDDLRELSGGRRDN